MDGVRPVAAAAREQRRAARKVLDGVDALLRSLEDEVGGGGEVARRAAPAVSFGRRLGSCGVAAAASRRVRASVTPGPGAYAVEMAVASVKPRVVAAAFRVGGCSCRLEACTCLRDKRRHQHIQDEASAPTSRADAGLGADAKAAVQYRARATPNFRTFEQKQRVRVVLAARQRWRRVGFHSVSHRLVERRVDVGHVAFSVSTGGEKRAQVRLRRKFRAWKHTVASPKPPQQDATAGGSKANGDGKARVTAQWKRARASRLLQESERRKNAQPTPSTDARSMSRSLRALPAHDMKRQSGRDNVHCRSKHLKAVLRFCDDVLKEHSCPPNGGDTPVTRTSESKSQRAPFSVAIGRDGARFDQASGLYLVAEGSPRPLILAPTDANTRLRARVCVMSSTREDPPKSNAASSLAYSPKYALVDRATRGHRFVTFESQRPRSAAPRGDDREQVILTPELAKVYDQQVFRRAARVIDYNKMLGRLDQ